MLSFNTFPSLSFIFKRLLFLNAFLVPAVSFGQNLVVNPSFETANCPTGYNGFPSQVELYMPGWYAANCASPDPMTNCSINTGQAVNTSVPDVWFGNQTARTGTNYMGFGHYGFTEFLGARLSAPLVAGEVYRVSFYVSCADQVKYASDALGMYFSTTQVKASSGNCLSGTILNLTPQVVSTPGIFLTDYTGWMEVSGTYTALGGEEYIAIGCFVPFNTTTMNHLYSFPGAADPAYLNSPATRLYYYIDDVSVEKDPLPIQLLSFEGSSTGQKATLRWAATEENNSCQYEIQKSKDGLSFLSLDTIKTKEDNTNNKYYEYTDPENLYQRNYYRLKLVGCNGVVSFSAVVSLNPSGVATTVYPNPVHDRLTIVSDPSFPVRKITVQNLIGNSLSIVEAASETELNISFEAYSPGIYTLIIEHSSGERLFRKILKE